MEMKELPTSIQEFWDEEREGGYPMRWFLVADGIDAEGEPAMASMFSNMKTWQLRGLLEETLADQIVGQTVDQLTED